MPFLIMLLSCTGKQYHQSSNSNVGRFIPSVYKSIYIADVYNYTQLPGLAQNLRKELIRHFQNSKLLSHEPTLKNSDVFLEIELLQYRSNEVFLIHRQLNGIQIKLETTLKMTDVKKKVDFLSDKKITVEVVSDYQELENYGESYLQERLYKKLASYLDNIINYGNIKESSLNGYEDLESKRRTLLPGGGTLENFRVRKKDDYGSEVDTEKSLYEAEKKRLEEIKRRDRQR